MGLDRDTALITVAADLWKLAGIRDTANLEGGGFDLDDLLLEAHRWVFDWLDHRGRRPEDLSNETTLKRAMAYYTASQLAQAGHLGGDDDEKSATYLTRAEKEMDEFRARYADEGAAGRRASEDIPVVGDFGVDGSAFLHRDFPEVI